MESRTRSPPPPTWSAWHPLAPTTILIPLCNASNLRARDCPPRTCILAAWNVSRIAQWMSKFNLKLVLGQENFAVFTLNCARLQGEQGNHVQGKRIHKGEVPGGIQDGAGAQVRCLRTCSRMPRCPRKFWESWRSSCLCSGNC